MASAAPAVFAIMAVGLGTVASRHMPVTDWPSASEE
jgi:hypothetical protein